MPFLRNTNLNYAKIRPNLAFNFTISCLFAKFPESNLNAISSYLSGKSTQPAISSQFSFLFPSCLRRSSSQFGHGTKKNRGERGKRKTVPRPESSRFETETWVSNLRGARKKYKKVRRKMEKRASGFCQSFHEQNLQWTNLRRERIQDTSSEEKRMLAQFSRDLLFLAIHFFFHGAFVRT